MGVSRTLPLDRVSQIKSQITTNVQAAVPNIAVSVNTIPQALDDETILERVLLTAAQRRTPIHHVIVQNVEGRRSVSMDMEVDARMSIGAAHAKATKLETAIRDELGADTEVETHIEPLRVKHLDGNTAPEAVSTAVAKALTSAADGIAGLSNIHDIRVRDTREGLVINYHCQFDANRDVAFVHQAVDELERLMRSTWPNLARIIGHAEPTRAAGV